jgi:shikimate kinase
MTHVVLVGLMGSGKTTVGGRVAEVLGRPFVDSDSVIEARTRRTVREIWRADGEAAYRVLERDALLDAVRSTTPSVIAAAGGVVLSADNRSDLVAADATVVWLHADPDTLVARATRGEHRPLLDDDPAGVLAQMADDREPLYREVADVVVEVADRTVDEVVDDVLAAVKS